MPLHILLTLVVGGIGFLALMMHVLGHSQRFDLSDASRARAEWQRHWPEDVIRHVYLAEGAALVDTDAGPGLLRPFGADTVGHRIHDITPLPEGLRVGFGAFEAPALTVVLAAQTAQLWQQVWQEAKHG